MSMLQRLVTKWTVSSASPSLVSALRNFSEREGSRRYTHVRFSIQSCWHITCSWCVLFVVITYITSDELLQTWDLYLCHSETAPNHVKWQILHDVAFESARLNEQRRNTTSKLGSWGSLALRSAKCSFWFSVRHIFSPLILAQTGLFFFILYFKLQTKGHFY